METEATTAAANDLEVFPAQKKRTNVYLLFCQYPYVLHLFLASLFPSDFQH